MEPLPSNMKKPFSFPYLLLGCMLLVLSYAVFDRAYPVVILRTTVLNSPAPGQDAVVKIEVDRQRACYTRIETSVFDGAMIKYNLPDLTSHVVGEVGLDTFSFRVPIDYRAAPGKGIVRFVTIWVCNYVHVVWPLVQVRDVPISIVESSNRR